MPVWFAVGLICVFPFFVMYLLFSVLRGLVAAISKWAFKTTEKTFWKFATKILSHKKN